MQNLCRVSLENKNPFGGLPVVLVGDFLQLPPVVPEDDLKILNHRRYEVCHAFGAKCLAGVPVKWIELNTVYRQKDIDFIELLGKVRSGADLQLAVEFLNRRCHRPHRTSAKPILLTSRIADAEDHNRIGLSSLHGPVRTYTGIIKYNFRITKDKLPAPEKLSLKINARVMFVKNDSGKRWVNGSLGTVTRLSKSEVWVRLDCESKEHEVHPTEWESIEYQYDPFTERVKAVVVGTYTQIPLVHAWAMTIHKAQGLTLEDVRIDLGAGAFSTGQTYVALSRATTLEGLSFHQPLKLSDVKADHLIVEALKRMTGAADQGRSELTQ